MSAAGWVIQSAGAVCGLLGVLAIFGIQVLSPEFVESIPGGMWSVALGGFFGGTLVGNLFFFIAESDDDAIDPPF